MNIKELDTAIHEQLSHANLLSVLDPDSSQILDMGGEVWVEIVLTDATRNAEAEALIRPLLNSSDNLVVRSLWKILNISDPQPAYGSDGGLRAAVLVSVALASGAKQISVTVAITKMAEWELESILGGEVPFKKVAEIIVESSLKRGGRSAWDPISQNYLEVASSGVANISRLIQQAA